MSDTRDTGESRPTAKASIDDAVSGTWFKLINIHDRESALRAAWRGGGVLIFPVVLDLLSLAAHLFGLSSTLPLSEMVTGFGASPLVVTVEIVLRDIVLLAIAWRVASGRGYLLAILALALNLTVILCILILRPLSFTNVVLAGLLFCLLVLPAIDGVRGTWFLHRRKGAMP